MPLSKRYVTEQIAAADPEDRKSSVRFATTQALAAYTRTANSITADANGAMAAQDGITPALNDRFLLLHGAAGADNGIWVVDEPGDGSTPFSLTRAVDANSNDKVTFGMQVRVAEGLVYGNSGQGTEFLLVTPDPIVLNTTALDFQEIELGGAGGNIEEVSDGTQKEVAAGTASHYTSLKVTDGDLLVDGSVHPVSPPRNYLIERVPANSKRLVRRYDVSHFVGSLPVEGVLSVSGLMRDVSPDTGLEILGKLGDELALDEFVIGTAGDAEAKTPAEVRTILDVLTAAEVDAAALAAVSPFAGLTTVQTVGAGPHAVTVGNLYNHLGGDTTYTLPATASNGAIFGFFAWENDILTLDGNGNQVSMIGAGSPTLEIEMDKTIVYFRYDAGNNTWDVLGDGVHNVMARQPYSVLATDGNGDAFSFPGGPYLALSETSPVTATTVPGELNATVRFRVNSAGARTLQLPASPSDGDRVGFQHWGNASNAVAVTLDGNGENIESIFDPTATVASFLFVLNGSCNIVCRYVSSGIIGNERWVVEAHGGALDVYRGGDTLVGHYITHGDGGGGVARTDLQEDDALLGKVGGSNLQEISPFHLQALLASNVYDVQFTDTGSQSGFEPGGTNPWAFTSFASWNAFSDLTIHGLVAPSSSAFSPVKVLRNEAVFDNVRMIFQNESVTEGTPANRILTPRGEAFYLGPQEAVVVKYDFNLSRWVLMTGVTPMSLVQSAGDNVVLGGTSGGVVFARALADNSIVYRATGLGPDDLPVPASTIVGRAAAGNISALTAAQVRTIINVEDGATADQTNSEIQTAYDAGLTEQTLTDAATIAYDVSSGRNANVTITADRVLNWTNPVAGQRGVVRIIQDGAGGHSITAYQLAGVAGDVLFAGGTAPTLTATAGAQDVLEWYYDGADIHVRVFSLDSQ